MKIGGKIKELATIGVAYSEDGVENLVDEAKEWIPKDLTSSSCQEKVVSQDY